MNWNACIWCVFALVSNRQRDELIMTPELKDEASCMFNYSQAGSIAARA
jgi:hypothetical protein